MTVAVDHAITAQVTPMKQLHERRRSTVTGKVLWVEVSAKDGDPFLVARLTDGTGSVDCVFLGRRTIPGIEPGAVIAAEGMVTVRRGALTIFNPRYELK